MFLNLNLRTQYLSLMSCAAGLALIFLAASGCDGNGASDLKINASRSPGTLQSSTSQNTSVSVNSWAAAEHAAGEYSPEDTRAELSEINQETSIRTLEEPREVTFAEAETAFQERRYDEGIRLFAAYTEQHNTNPWGFFMLGLSAMKSGDAELAETSFIRALELDSTHVKSWLNLGRTLLDMYRGEEALLAVEHAFELDPESNEAYRIKGRSLHAMGRLEDAADAYRDALRLDDTDVWAMNNLALILIEQERYELALPSLARATQLRTDIAVIYNNLGMALERTYRFRAAEKAYESAVSLDAEHSRAAANLARVKVVKQDSAIEAVDFGYLAQNFVEEIASWSDEAIARETPLIQPVAEPDPTAAPKEHEEHEEHEGHSGNQ